MFSFIWRRPMCSTKLGNRSAESVTITCGLVFSLARCPVIREIRRRRRAIQVFNTSSKFNTYP